MPSTDAVSASPTRAVPVTVGTPVGAVLPSRFRIVPTASPSAIPAPVALLSRSRNVSPESSSSSSASTTQTVCSVSYGSKVSVPSVRV